MHDLTLSRFARESLLLENGVSRIELAVAVRTDLKVKSQRRQTIVNLDMELGPIEEDFERWSRKVRTISINIITCCPPIQYAIR